MRSIPEYSLVRIFEGKTKTLALSMHVSGFFASGTFLSKILADGRQGALVKVSGTRFGNGRGVLKPPFNTTDRRRGFFGQLYQSKTAVIKFEV